MRYLFVLLVVGVMVSCDSEPTIIEGFDFSDVEDDGVKDDAENKSTCTICGNAFSGRGYKLNYVGDCNEVQEPYQSFICTCNCANKARQNLDNAVAELRRHYR